MSKLSSTPVLRVSPTSSVRDGLGKLIVQATIDANRPIILERSAPSALKAFKQLDVSEAERPTRPICIVGAGCAGLYAAMILDTLGLSYEILEANDRIGGRILTHRFNGEAGEKAPVNDPARYDYIDMGAMRYPNTDFMERVFKLFTRLEMDHLLIEYKYKAANTFKLYNGVRHNSSETVQAGDDTYNVSEAKGGAVPDSWVARGVDNVSDGIYAPFAEAFRTLPFQEAWAKLTEFDPYSTRGYLLAKGYPETVIEWLETFQTATGLYNDAFVESTMDAMDFGTPAPTKAGIWGEARDYGWYCIDGGSDQLTTRMEGSLKTKPIKGARVTGISSLLGGNDMEVVYQKDGRTERKLYSQVICTVPLGCLAAIEIPSRDTSYMKRMAIRSLNYDTSTKVALKFATRWWEDPKVMGEGHTIKGGISSTDLPIRTVVYPSYGFKATGPVSGVILASYTWAQDAQRLGGLAQAKGSEADKLLVDLTLRNLSELHGVPIEKFGKLEDHFVTNWHQDENARGAFALFGPGQFGQPVQGNSMFASLKAPAAHGRLHIAGEATSVHHAWVLGALNSAWRAVYNALGLLGYEEAEKKRKLLEEIWGVPTETDKEALGELAILGDAQIL